jgi:hypothetical protein
MEVHLTPEEQHQLAELAAQRGRDADALAQEAISRYLAEEARFIEAVKLGEEAQARRISHARASGRTARPAVPTLTWMEVRWSTLAAEDLERIFQRIATDNPSKTLLEKQGRSTPFARNKPGSTDVQIPIS